MSTRSKDLYRRVPGIPAQEIQGQAVIVVPARRELHELDDVGTLVWRALEEKKRSLEHLARAVCDEYDGDPKQVELDLRTFLERLEEKGLVVRT